MTPMDNFDEFSDCSDSSKTSECYSSDVSTVSNLEEYKEEFLELKQLVKSSNIDCDSAKCSTTSKSILSWYEKEIKKLNGELQSSLKQNEIYKNTIYNFEKKDILYTEKVEKLLIQNQQLKDNLLAANNQVQRLLNICDKSKDNTKTALLEENNLQLEKNITGFASRNYVLSTELNQCNLQKSEVENEFKKLKSEYNELKLELAAKITSVNELKTKISEQHVQLQDISQNKVKLSHSSDLISNELEFVKKSEKWHKEELHRFQEEKRYLRETILEKERFIASQEETVEQLKLDLNSLRCSCDEFRLTSLKEKEKLLKQFELDDKHITKNKSESNVHRDIGSNIGSITNHYESIISDLTSDVLKMKSNFEYQQKCLENASKEKSEIMGKLVFLQNSLKDKEDAIEKFESFTRDWKERLSFYTTRQEEQTSELLNLKETCAKLNSELCLKNQDMEIFEESVGTIKKQFKLFISKYSNLKNELHKNNRELSHLLYEKEQLCIENDRRLFAANKNFEKSALEIDQLRQKITCLESVEKNAEAQNKKHVAKIEIINAELVKIQQSYDNLRNQTENNVVLDNGDFFNKEQQITNSDAVSRDSLNIESKFFVLYSSKVEDLLRNICNLCSISYDDYCNFSANKSLNLNEDTSDFIQLLLNKIQAHIQLVQVCKTESLTRRAGKLNLLRRKIVGNIFNLMKRCEILEISNEENIKVLKTLRFKNDKSSDLPVEIQRLQTQLQVKAQEAKNKQKRYEKNYRTLLRKVKEHMRGRKATEKHNAYLQELHNTVSAQCNTLRLELDSKISEKNELQSRLEKASTVNGKLKSTLLKLEDKFSMNNSCSKCADLQNLKKRETELEKSIKDYENSNSANINALKLKEDLLESLQKKKEQLLTDVSSRSDKYKECVARIESVTQENTALTAKIINIEKQLTQENSINEQIRRQLKILENENFEKQNENNVLNNKLQHITERDSHLLAELKDLKSCLQSKSEEVTEWQQRKEHLGRKWLEQETNMQHLISSLISQIREFKIEIDTIKNEKFFLQRLCNDLKVALTTHVGQNKALKQFLENIHKQREKNGNESIILSNFPSPVIYDGVHIDKLLKECKAPLEDKPFCDIQDGLNNLRMEILSLQKQIAEKNIN